MGIWTLVMLALIIHGVTDLKRSSLETARHWARSHFEKDISYRRWNAYLGGVYAEVTPKTQPNPFLAHLPDRDILTTSGRSLTLINPAYMTRQVYEMAKEKDQVLGHITSLTPIRPENGPDAWERQALQAFAAGKDEVSELQEMGGQPYLRLMRPLIMEQECLKCHADQGAVGDIRGGISVAVPMSSIWATWREHTRAHFTGYGLIWLLGMTALTLGSRRLGQNIRRREQAELALHTTNLELETRSQDLAKTIETLQIEINERQQVEEKLRHGERFLADIFDSILDGISILDKDYNILRTNRIVEHWQADAIPLVGKKCYRAYHGRDEPCEVCPSRRVMETGQPATEEKPSPEWKADVPGWIEINSFPMVDPATGKINGIIEYIRDISPRKAAEEALRQSQKMEAVGRLAGGVAHDFNNILTAISGYSDFLLLGLGEGELRQEVLEIQKATDRASSLTRQLLAFSRKQIFAPKVLNLNDLVMNLDKMLRRLLSEDIELVAIPGPNLGEVMADPVRSSRSSSIWWSMPGMPCPRAGRSPSRPPTSYWTANMPKSTWTCSRALTCCFQ